MSNENQFVEAIIGAKVANDLGIPLGQQKEVGALLVNRARVNNAVQTREILGNVVADAEGTSKYADPYAVGFAGNRFNTDSPHPGFLGGEYKGKKSSAAGKYQFNLATWKEANGGKNAPMTPENQEKAFDYLLKKRHKVTDQHLMDGDFGSILPRLHSWAALPASKSKQPQRDYAYLADSIKRHGGTEDMLKSLDSIITGVKTPNRLTPQQIERAVAPRKDELAQRSQQSAEEDAARMEQQAATDTANRNVDIESMIAEALQGKNNLVEEPSGLPTQWDDQLMKIIKAV
jgi:muramidase (phage lysozyme)